MMEGPVGVFCILGGAVFPPLLEFVNQAFESLSAFQ